MQMTSTSLSLKSASDALLPSPVSRPLSSGALQPIFIGAAWPAMVNAVAADPPEEHARGPVPAANQYDHRARVSRSDPRRHRPRARAGHHHPDAPGHDLPRIQRPAVRTEPDRYAGPRRFQLRSQPFFGRV